MTCRERSKRTHPHFCYRDMEEEKRRVLNDVFGDSSSLSEDEYEYEQHQHLNDSNEVNSSENPCWEQIKEIKGLWLCRDFLSSDHHLSLLLAIQKEGWFTDASHNQAMKFGDLPAWATELSRSIRKAVCMFGDLETCPLPSNIIWREPLFDQLIVNAYQPGEGICAHVDLMRFEDGIAIVSLESSCVMHFTRAETDFSAEKEPKKETPVLRIPVFLTPGSLILMYGEARYLWKHEINRKPGFQVWEGREIDQQKRISVTLRKLCHSV